MLSQIVHAYVESPIPICCRKLNVVLLHFLVVTLDMGVMGRYRPISYIRRGYNNQPYYI